MALVTQTFSDIITFTRASSATYFDATGTLQTATTDQPRFDYNPSTLAAQGLLIEEARTNLALQSADFGTTWGQANVTVSTNAVVSPDGTSNADNMLEAATTSEHYLRQFFTGLTANTVYTTTVFVKSLNGRNLRIRVLDTDNVANGYFITVSPSLGTVVQSATVVGSASSVSGIITPVNGGWYRVILSGNAGASCTKYTLDFFSMDGTTNNFAGDITKGLTLFGAQLELGAFPTSYIPTTSSAVTRAADVASVNTLSPWFNAAEGTLYAQFLNGNDNTGQRFAAINDGSGNNTIEIISSGTSVGPYVFVQTGGSGQTPGPSPTTPIATNTQYKAAVAYATNNTAGFVDGVQNMIDTTSVTIPTGLTKLQIGSQTTSTLWSNAWIQRITYYPRRLSQAEGIAITS